ncbi:MAG: hypothetical protein EA402_13370 [Planctomycetota bacterium]|nr:MAG: hypothetical protein EA402_13370 [Planctomycetota bacterium]
MAESSVSVEKLLAQHCLELAEIIEKIAPQDYVSSNPNGSIGEQVRHGLDHLQALLAGAEAEIIDYEQRRRGWVGERKPALAVSELRQLSHCFHRLSGADPTRSLSVVVQVDPGQEPAQWPSTWGRECVAMLSHEVHHAAMLRPRLEAAGCSLPAHFGIAPSTVAHRSTCAASA